MKWLALALALAVLYPLGRAARANPRLRAAFAAMLGFLPFYEVHVNFFSNESYRGDSRGLEITLLDLVGVVLAIALPERTRRHAAPFRWQKLAYLLVVAISVSQAELPLFAMFGLWKVVRLFAVSTVAARAVDDELGGEVYRGLLLGVCYSAFLALKQRYFEGYMQAKGPFSHQNGLGMAMNMVVPGALALWLGGNGGRLAMVAVVAGALCHVLALSRGGMVLFVVACGVVFGTSFARKPTSKKAKILGLAALGVLGVLAKSLDTIMERFTKAPAGSEEGRKLFEAAARAMHADHPFGVGINHFSHVLDVRGYADRIGIPLVDRNGIVHNIWWLTLAELGTLGLLAFVALYGSPVLLALRRAFFGRPGVARDLLLGWGAGLAVTLVQGKLEWSLRTTSLGQITFLLFGLIAGVSRAR